jgi:hypothetical protein
MSAGAAGIPKRLRQLQQLGRPQVGRLLVGIQARRIKFAARSERRVRASALQRFRHGACRPAPVGRSRAQ